MFKLKIVRLIINLHKLIYNCFSISCLPDPTTNSVPNPDSYGFFDQSQPVLPVSFFISLSETIWFVKKLVIICDSGFIVSELVAGSDEHDTCL